MAIRRNWEQCLIWFAILLASASLKGEGRYCVVDSWGTGAGLLPQTSIISMLQTKDGYLWLGTRDGLARFDGVSFTIFDESDTPELSSIQAVKLFEDSRSNLWIGTASAGVMLVTNGGVLKLDVGHGRGGHLASICEDGFGAVWMLTEDRELARYQAGKLDVWRAGGAYASFGRAVIAEKNGPVWVATDRSLVAINASSIPQNGSLPERFSVPVGEVDMLLASRDGGYWKIADGEVQKCAGVEVKRDFGAYPWKRDVLKPVAAACEDRDGNLVVGVRGQGVFWYDADGHATHISSENGLANDFVLSMVADADGNLWVGMDGGGKSERPLNRVARSVFNVLESSSGLVVQSICADNQGGLWYSPKNSDFHYWKDGIDKTVGSMPGPMSLFNPSAVLVDSSQKVWAATLGANLFQLNNGQFTFAPGVANLNREISALYEGHDGRLWVGTQGGLQCWNGESWQVFGATNGLTGNIVRAIADDSKSNLWIGTEDGGLDLMTAGKITSSFRRANGFPSDNISCLYLDARSVLWVGTLGNGLIRLENGHWKHYTTQNGLTGNGIDYVIEDDQGFLWIGSNDGLMRLNKKQLDDSDPNAGALLNCRDYDEKDGLPATECTYGSQPAACRSPAGLLWFPTINGMVSVQPAAIQPNTNPPPVVIEQVLVDEQPQFSTGLRALPPQSVTVPAGRENLEIQYTSLDPGSAGRADFRYQLQGYQTAPHDAGKVRFVRYPNLPHGHYVFHVEARNEDGIWNHTGAELEVIVLPAFWQTWWFRLVVAAALLGIIVATVHLISTQKLQRQLAGLRQQQALDKERARIARDIHDQVGASLTQLSLLGEMVEADKNNPAEAGNHARQITQTARETAHELDEIVWTVNPSNDTLDGLVTYICKHAQEYLAVAGLRYRLDVPTELPASTISPEARHNVFLAAKEAVTNVVRHARASEAWLRLRVSPDSFTVEIEDNGRGPQGMDSKAAEARNGLRNMRKRMEDIGGGFFIGPGAQGGTLVRLTVPLRNR